MVEVQGPTLAFVVDREIEIRNHIPVPYWTITGEFEKDGHIVHAYYYPQKLDSLHKATLIVNACKNQDGKVTEIKVQKITLKPPYPFNLGDLQKEAYRVFKFSPSFTLSVAEKLYLSALISYPRTSSQKLPVSINYRKIVSGLSKISFRSRSAIHGNEDNEAYADLAMRLLSKDRISPNEGSKTDPAHPAIYPTGQKPKGRLDDVEFKLFDLIAKRFFATFGDPCVTQQTIVTILVKDIHIFKAEGKRVLYEGWGYFYKPYANMSNVEMPIALSTLHKGDILKNVDITLTKKLTQPPVRFNQSSLLEKMEKEKIGTKATRSEIINTLYKRNYIANTVVPSRENSTEKEVNDLPLSTGIKPTDIGFEIIRAMRKYVPNIVSTGLTRSMDKQLEKIESGKIKSEFVVDHAKNKLKEALVFFKENQREIGAQMTSAVKATKAVVEPKNRQQVILGVCPVCNRGDLVIKKSNKKRKRFAGCSLYSSDKCTATSPLPQKGRIKNTGKICTECTWPIIKCTYSLPTKHQWQFCINTQCQSKGNTNNRFQGKVPK